MTAKRQELISDHITALRESNSLQSLSALKGAIFIQMHQIANEPSKFY